MHEHTHEPAGGQDVFPQAVDDLPDATSPSAVEVPDGGALDLRIGPVRKRVAGELVRMLAYNDSVPGPILRVRQGTAITVDVTNDTDLEQTVHWHGLRLNNRFDGVPYETQAPVPVGGRFRYQLQFPDPGVYWYHPHIREDYGQEMGLYGQIIVEPSDPDYWSPVNREIPLTLDDVLLVDGQMPAFRRSGPTHTMMGRFGTVLLVGGETRPSFEVKRGEVVRLYLTNTANTRTFNVAIAGATLKLIGGDSGRREREEIVESVIIAPSERAILDVYFDRPGEVTLEHRTPGGSSPLATVNVADEAAAPLLGNTFRELRHDLELTAERARLASDRDRAPDRSLVFVGEMDMGAMDDDDMAMEAMDMEDTSHVDGADDGIEWEDEMPEMNLMSKRENMAWKIIDTQTGAVNADISWTLRVGERVKIRLDNAAGSDHEMHHPFHIHGAGRFLVLDRGGVPEANLVWKDTVLVRAGEVVNILFDVTNPGRWMAHCHIAEHNETGMMFSFDVSPK